MSTITHIHHDSAARIRDILVHALGTETIPHQWQIFMRSVRRELPMLASRGRPTQQQVQGSIIGALGFQSWREMCETPTADGGLGLNWSKWRQWSRAYAVVDNNPGLRNAPLTAAEINKLYADARAAGEEMPGDMDAVEAFQTRQAERKKAAREETQAAMKKRVEALEADLVASREEVARTNGAVAELREMLDSAQLALAEAEQEKRQALLDLRSLQQVYEQTSKSMSQADEYAERMMRLNQSLQRELDEYRNRGFFQRLRDVFSPQ